MSSRISRTENIQLVWKKRAMNTQCLYLGRIKVGHIQFIPIDERFLSSCYLDDTGSVFSSEERAKAFVDRHVNKWLTDAGLTGGDNEQQ